MFLFYVLSFSKKGDTIQGGTLFKGGQYLRKYGKLGSKSVIDCWAGQNKGRYGKKDISFLLVSLLKSIW